MANFEEDILGKSTLIQENLAPFGFTKVGDVFRLQREILGGEFLYTLEIGSTGEVSGMLLDQQTNEPYNLYQIPSAHGEFVASIRDAIKEILHAVKDACYRKGEHSSDAFLFVRNYCVSHYQEDVEYLWDDDENCIVRRQDNRKWYAVIMRVLPVKIGSSGEEKISVLALRGDPTEVDYRMVYPGYHLNKKSWITLVLDERTPRDLLVRYLESSRERALGKKK